MEKSRIKAAFVAGWYAGLDESTGLDRLFEEWYTEFMSEQPAPAPSGRRGW